MKKLFLYAAALLAAISFPGCSDDDDEGVAVTVESLVGRWSCYQEEDWDEVEMKMIMDDEFGEGVDLYIVEVNADGTGRVFDGLYLSELADENNWNSFTYTLKGAQLIIQKGQGDGARWRVSKITSSELVLAWDEPDDNGIIYPEKIYFRRMK